MTPEEHKQLAARVLEKNKVLEGLQANPDFQDWLELVPKAELEIIKSRILSADRTNDGWERKVTESVIEYQALRHAIFELTDIRLKAVAEARKVMKELDT